MHFRFILNPGYSDPNTADIYLFQKGFPRGTSGKEHTCQFRRHKIMGSIPGLGRSPEGGHGNPFQYSCVENPMDRGAWVC